MKFEFVQGKDFVDLGDSFDILKKIKEDFKDVEFDEKPVLSRLFNKFSGGYFSPTFVKSFMSCPMRCFLTYFDPRTSNPITNLGSATHKVYERVISEKIFDRKEQEIVANEEFINFQLQKDQISTYKKYVDNFLKFDDYDGAKLFSGSYQYFPENFIREDNMTVFGCDMGSCYCLIDRIDVDIERKIINIVDYKTGKVVSLDNIISNYTDQMITYDWAVMANFEGFETRSYLYLPDTNSYILINTKDIETQSKLVDKVFDFYEFIRKQRSDNVMSANVSDDCKYCQMKGMCNAYNGKIVSEKIVKEVEDPCQPKQKT